MDFHEALTEAAKAGPAESDEVITVNEYIDRVAAHPSIAATAHQRIHDMIRAAGSAPGLHAGRRRMTSSPGSCSALTCRSSASSATSRRPLTATRRGGGSC